MKNLIPLLFLSLFLSLTGCTIEDESDPFPNQEILSHPQMINAEEMGLLHNEAMDFIDRNIEGNFNETNSVAASVINLTWEYLESKNLSIDENTLIKVEELTEYIDYDDIHINFQKNIKEINEAFYTLQQKSLISHLDVKQIQGLTELLFKFNDHVINEKLTSFIADEFLNSIEILYDEYEQEKERLSPITIGLFEIMKSSSEYWSIKEIQETPDFITRVNYKMEILPAIVVRVIIKDALGAFEGFLTKAMLERIKNNDWDWDTGKISEEEALEAMLIGAITNSGGFLGKAALKALNFVM